MAQTVVDFSGDPSGDQLLDDLLYGLQDSILTNNSGTVRPSYAKNGTDWFDTSTTPWEWKVFNGTDDITLGWIDPSSLDFTPNLPDGIIANVKLADMPAKTFKANITNSSDTPDDITEVEMRQFFNIVSALGNVTTTATANLNNARSFSATVTGNVTWTFSNPLPTGYEDVFTLRLENGGAFTTTWPASVDWVSGTAPTLTTAGFDEIVFKTIDGGTTWVGAASLDVK